jgi:hypothetical protein
MTRRERMLNEQLFFPCHPDPSEAEWRDPRFAAEEGGY